VAGNASGFPFPGQRLAWPRQHSWAPSNHAGCEIEELGAPGSMGWGGWGEHGEKNKKARQIQKNGQPGHSARTPGTHIPPHSKQSKKSQKKKKKEKKKKSKRPHQGAYPLDVVTGPRQFAPLLLAPTLTNLLQTGDRHFACHPAAFFLAADDFHSRLVLAPSTFGPSLRSIIGSGAQFLSRR